MSSQDSPVEISSDEDELATSFIGSASSTPLKLMRCQTGASRMRSVSPASSGLSSAPNSPEPPSEEKESQHLALLIHSGSRKNIRRSSRPGPLMTNSKRKVPADQRFDPNSSVTETVPKRKCTESSHNDNTINLPFAPEIPRPSKKRAKKSQRAYASTSTTATPSEEANPFISHKKTTWTPAIVEDFHSNFASTFPAKAFASKHGISIEELNEVYQAIVILPLLSHTSSPVKTIHHRIRAHQTVLRAFKKRFSKADRAAARRERDDEAEEAEKDWAEYLNLRRREREEVVGSWKGTRRELEAWREGCRVADEQAKEQHREERERKRVEWRRRGAFESDETSEGGD